MLLATQHPSYFTIVEPSSQGVNPLVSSSLVVDVRKTSLLDIIAQDWSKFHHKLQEKGQKRAVFNDFELQVHYLV